MLLAQVNRDSQAMEFQSVDGDSQQVTLCLTEAVTVAGKTSKASHLQNHNLLMFIC